MSPVSVIVAGVVVFAGRFDVQTAPIPMSARSCASGSESACDPHFQGVVHEARAMLFDYDSWLDAADQLIGYLDAELAAFAKHYSSHFELVFPTCNDGGWFGSLRSK